MIAYHGDPKVKAKYLRRVRAHAKADAIIKQGSSMTPLALVPDETPIEHLRNAQQILRSYAFLSDADRMGDPGLAVITGALYRVTVAVKGLEWAAERQAIHERTPT